MQDRLFQMMRGGAAAIASLGGEFTAAHAEAGLLADDWAVLRSPKYWRREESIRSRAALSRLVEASFTLAGIPPVALPAEYVAATITEVVSPCNWIVAATQSQGALDGQVLATPTGDQQYQKETVSAERMIALVFQYHQACDERLVDTPFNQQEIEETIDAESSR